MVELRKIDADNYLKILGMELPSRQQSFVASNAVSDRKSTRLNSSHQI